MPALRFIPLLILAVAVSACSTQDPNAVSRSEVEGIHAITQLRFVPNAAAVQPADVAARFDPAFTSVELLGSGDVLLRYRLQGESSVLVTGRYSMTRNGVRLEFAASERPRLDPILLPSVVRLQLGAQNLLTADITMTANLDAYDRTQYQGLTSVNGVLRVRLERQVN